MEHLNPPVLEQQLSKGTARGRQKYSVSFVPQVNPGGIIYHSFWYETIEKAYPAIWGVKSFMEAPGWQKPSIVLDETVIKVFNCEMKMSEIH